MARSASCAAPGARAAGNPKHQREPDMIQGRFFLALLFPMFLCCGCSSRPGVDTGNPSSWECLLDQGEEVDFSQQIGCWDDFDLLASDPLDASIPGARSVKTDVDRSDDDALYFQNSKLYQVHWDFASEFLSGDGLPIVADMATFNSTEYYSPDRRFILGAVTWYEEPGVWVYEISPYDSATADMIATAFYLVRDNAYFGDELYFHPSSESVEAEAENLPDDIPIITTEELYAGITYQPLNLGTSMGKLTFYAADEFQEDAVNYREIVALENVPADIAVVSGIITQDFQTPLSHINVLSQNRGTPNMALSTLFQDEELLSLEGRWIELTVEAMDYSVREVTQEEADAWWEEHKPDPLEVTPMDLSVTGLWDIQQVLDLESYDLADALSMAIPAFGGKASHFGGLVHIGDDVPLPDAFAIPVYYYNQFMEQNGLWDVVNDLLNDQQFEGDSSYRQERLQDLRDSIEAGTIDQDFLDMVIDKCNSEYSGLRMRFRSSTNAEDISGFNGAGLYTSQSGDPNDPDYPVDDAIRKVWASLWNYRAYDEREYFSIPHTDIGMAMLVHHSFPDEEANGVAITANIYDTSGLEPAFYVNVQEGEASVVQPEDGVTTDQFIYYYDMPGQPIVYLAHSSLLEDGETVLTTSQIYDLGTALSAIHSYFYPVYGNAGGFYGMDVEFKFDDDWGTSGEEELWIKQARPYPGWDATD